MALRGTLKDFGIADIFQLIGHQSKTGTLSVKNRGQTVVIYFSSGNVVRAEATARQKRDLLGAMLTRTEAITEKQLEKALAIQQKTLQRLGDILHELMGLDHSTLHTITKLQTTETIYRLFLWDSGSYEFENADVAVEERDELIRSENILMEGFRQADEWPMIRKVITGYGIVFERLEDLDKLLAEHRQEDAEGAAGDDDFAEFDLDIGDGPKDSRLKKIGEHERKAYSLIGANRDVQKIIDLSRLGEFETCKALVNLVEMQIIAPQGEKELRAPSAAATVGGITGPHSEWSRVAFSAAMIILVLAGLWFVVGQLGVGPDMLFVHERVAGYERRAVQQLLSRSQIRRLRESLAVYRTQDGHYPQQLEQLVETGLAKERQLRQPWHETYFYQREAEGYFLLPPLD
ncbi:MAG: DUF4388 domain-containing protein [Myxococcota bacterium]